MKKLSKENKIRLIAVIIFILVAIIATILGIPFIKNMTTPEGRAEVIETVSSYGVWGWFLFLALQIIQVIIALIPGEPVEILAGILFGTIGGFLLCMLGMLIGTIIIYYLVKKIGKPLVNAFVSEDKMQNFKFLNDEKKLESIVFILFFIPGTPKDVLTYIVPLTKINPKNFFILSTLARIPSVISSTLVGSNLADGNWGLSILIFAITAVVGLLGININDRYTKKFNNKTKEKTIDK